MKLYPFQLKIGKVDAPGVSIAGFGKTAQTNFLQIFNQMLKSVKELARRMVSPLGQIGDVPVAPKSVKSVATGNSEGVGQSNKDCEILNLQAASVMPVSLENPGFPANDQTNVRQFSEKTINIVNTVENLQQSLPDRNAGIQNSTASSEFSGKQILTRNDLSEAGTFEDNSGHKKSVAGAAQRGLVEGNSAENTRLSGNAQIMRPASGNSEVITQRESGHNPVRNQHVADLSTGPENLSVPASGRERSDSNSFAKTNVQTADPTLAAGTIEDYGKLRRIIYRIFSRKQGGYDLITSNGLGKTGKNSSGQFIQGNVPDVPGEATVKIAEEDPLLSGKAVKILSVKGRILSKSGSDTRTAESPAPRHDGKSIEMSIRSDEDTAAGRDGQNPESHSRTGLKGDFQKAFNLLHDLKDNPQKPGPVTGFHAAKEENIAAKAAEQDKGYSGNRNSGGIASAAGKTKEITPNVLTREKAPAMPEKPPTTGDLPEQIARSVINGAETDGENLRMPETIARISLIQKVTQFIEQSAQSGIKRQFSLQLKTDENELVEMRFVRENRQNRGKIWVSSESMVQHLQRNLSAIQDNLLQKGIQFAELTVQLHNSDDFRSGEKNMNSRRANKKEERNLRTIESKQQQATVRTAYKYGYNTVEFIA